MSYIIWFLGNVLASVIGILLAAWIVNRVNETRWKDELRSQKDKKGKRK